MLDQATKPAKEQWLEILEQAASGYLEGARDPKQIRSRRRQLDLLEAATRVFARDGIAKAKMADIAAEAGISVSSIYDYYPSKEDLAYEIPIRRLAQFYAEFHAQALPLRNHARAPAPVPVHGDRLCASQSRLGTPAVSGDLAECPDRRGAGSARGR